MNHGIRRDIIILSCGLITTLLTVIALFLFERFFKIAIYSFTVFFFPLGGLGVGYIMVRGYYIGSKLTNHEPPSIMQLIVIILSIFSFYLIYFLLYQSTVHFQNNDLFHVNNNISFIKFMSKSIESKSIYFNASRLSRQFVPVRGSPELGYINAFLQISAYIFWGFRAYNELKKKYNK